MEEKFDLPEGEKAPEINESRRDLLKIVKDQNTPVKGDSAIETVSRLAEFDPTMSRRGLFSLAGKGIAAVVVAKIATLCPGLARAEYTPKGFLDEMWKELNPNQIDAPGFDLLEDSDLPKPVLYYQHNVRGKIERQGVNIPTPSLVFELAKFCWKICRDKVANIESRRKVLTHLKETAAPGHRDYERIMKIYEVMTAVDKANKDDWQPLVKYAHALVKNVETLVSREEAAAKRTKAASPAQDLIGDVKDKVALAKPRHHWGEYDNWEEVLQDTRPKYFFSFQCGKLPAYNNNERPETNNLPTEAILMLRNVARIQFEAAVQRHKAYANILATAELEPDKNTKAKLRKIAHIQTNRPIRDGWAVLLSEEQCPATGRKGALIEFAQMMITASRNEMIRANEINRCAPNEFPNEQDYIDASLKDLQKILKGQDPRAEEDEE